MTLINFTPYLPALFSGTLITLALLVCSLTLAFCIALLLSIAISSNKPALTWPVNIYIFFIRGTPLLVQFFLIYFGSSQFAFIRESFLWDALKNPFVCAVLALTLNSAAYTTVLLRGAIRAIPKGEIEAGKALGLSSFLLLRKIILPRAFRLVLPAYSNEVVIILKGTSLASTITLLDLMGVTQNIISSTYATLEFLLLAGLIYLVLNASLIGFMRLIERRWGYQAFS
jgi:His/Glu/Gln/Arg/opine family amino acid ABC transporter permease subunit